MTGQTPARANDRARAAIGRVLDAADTADIRIGNLTCYSGGDLIAIQAEHRAFTDSEAAALQAALDLPVTRRNRGVVTLGALDNRVEIFTGTTS